MLNAIRKVDMICDVLRVLLRDAALPAHEVLSSRDLADAYEVSRTPVREALKQLETEGLLIFLPQQGYYPRVPTDAEFERAYAIRPDIAEHSLRRPEGARRPRRSKRERATTFHELAQLEEKATPDAPARMVETILLDIASHAPDAKRLTEARDNIAALAHLRKAEQTIDGHAAAASRMVRLYRAGKYDELLRALREFCDERRRAVPHLSRQIVRPSARVRLLRRGS